MINKHFEYMPSVGLFHSIIYLFQDQNLQTKAILSFSFGYGYGSYRSVQLLTIIWQTFHHNISKYFIPMILTKQTKCQLLWVLNKGKGLLVSHSTWNLIRVIQKVPNLESIFLITGKFVSIVLVSKYLKLLIVLLYLWKSSKILTHKRHILNFGVWHIEEGH